tara:strand:+ start:120 stop:506 length:387 start_codon:yes stop_codon:yes gene_type:complete
MKLSTDYENLLEHVVDGFNRNYFRNELKTNIKRNQDFEWSLNHVNNLLEKGEVTYPEHSPEGILKLDNSRYPYQDLLRQKKHYEYQVNVGGQFQKEVEDNLLIYLADQLEEAKKQLIAIQSKTSTEDN